MAFIIVDIDHGQRFARTLILVLLLLAVKPGRYQSV